MGTLSDHYYVVRCVDNERRHEHGFRTRVEAEHWAYWGHACTPTHTYSLHSYNDHKQCSPSTCKVARGS